MIKSFKIFESLKGKKYWLVPTDDRFLDFFKSVGIKDTDFIENMKSYLDRANFNNTGKPYVFIAYDEDDDSLSWMAYKGVIPNSHYEIQKHIFSGAYGITEEEDEEIYNKVQEYELKKNMNKYNL